VPGLLCGEEGVLFLHALRGGLDRRVASRGTAGELLHRLDPVVHALPGGNADVSRQHFRRRTHALDGHQLRHALGVGAGELQRDGSSQGMADHGEIVELESLHQLGHVEDELRLAVHASDRPGAVAVTAKIRGDDVVVTTQVAGHPVPAAGVVPTAVDQEQRGRTLVSPVHVVEPEPLRDVEARAGTDDLDTVILHYIRLAKARRGDVPCIPASSVCRRGESARNVPT
jgi:hypothetical protein